MIIMMIYTQYKKESPCQGYSDPSGMSQELSPFFIILLGVPAQPSQFSLDLSINFTPPLSLILFVKVLQEVSLFIIIYS